MNKYLVVYASRTGNTQKIAEAARMALGDAVDIRPIEENPSPAGYRWLAVGFWIDRDDADASVQAYLKELRDMDVALFCTLGTPPSMPQAKRCLDQAASHLPPDSRIIGQFLCQGRVDPDVAAQVEELAVRKGGDAMRQQFQAVIRSADSHPDEVDIQRAQAFFRQLAEQAE